MLALRQRLQRPSGEPLLAALAATLATLAIAVFAERRLGGVGLFVPLLLVGAVLLVRRPIAAVALAVAMPILCEGPTFGIPVMTKLYNPVFKQLTALDLLVALAAIAVALDLIRRGGSRTCRPRSASRCCWSRSRWRPASP